MTSCSLRPLPGSLARGISDHRGNDTCHIVVADRAHPPVRWPGVSSLPQRSSCRKYNGLRAAEQHARSQLPPQSSFPSVTSSARIQSSARLSCTAGPVSGSECAHEARPASTGVGCSGNGEETRIRVQSGRRSSESESENGSAPIGLEAGSLGRRHFGSLAGTSLGAVLSGGGIILQALAWPQPAEAFSLGVSGPREWLKEQKKRTAGNLLKKIDNSRAKLEQVLVLVQSGNGAGDGFREAAQIARDAARDCLPPEQGSFLELQASTGIEVCTYKLLLKNAASLLDDKDETKLAAEASLVDLIGSFQDLTNVLEGPSETRYGVTAAVESTKAALDRFQDGIKSVLGLPV